MTETQTTNNDWLKEEIKYLKIMWRNHWRHQEYYQKHKEKLKKQAKEYRLKNVDKVKEMNRNARNKNIKKISEQSKKKYYENRELYLLKRKKYREENPDKVKISKQKYCKNNRDKINCYRREFYKNNINFKIACNLRSRLNNAFFLRKIPKSSSSVDYKSIIIHLLETMPKDIKTNIYHIDHIIPLCAFDLTKNSELIKAMKPENHQWLPAIENLKKASKDKLLSIKIPKEADN